MADIWKARVMSNNTKIASGRGRTPAEAISNLEKSLESRNDGYNRNQRRSRR